MGQQKRIVDTTPAITDYPSHPPIHSEDIQCISGNNGSGGAAYKMNLASEENGTLPYRNNNPFIV